MAQPVSIEIQARTGQAEKQLAGFGKTVSAIGKAWESVMGGRGIRQAGANLQQLSRGMADFGKAADRANQRLQAINQTLEQTVKTRMKLVDASGKVATKDRDEYERLLQQEKALAGQQKSWQNIAAIRSRMAQNAGLSPGRNGIFGGGPGGLARFGSPLAEFAGTVGRGLLPGLVGVGIGSALGGMAVKAIKESIGAQEEASDFIPRMRPGALAGTDAFALNARMRGIGRPLGFSQRESLAVFRAMSEGGNFGHGLERDAQAAMQFGRMFGIDAGGEASMLATAQRTGAFQAGQARRFASMLATEIARTGLGPRAEEVQQATMMLLSRQLQDQPRANAAPLLALQTILNKTGTPAFQGVAGASFINQLQDAITHPNSEAAEALEFSAARRAGARTLYQYEFMKAQGINNPRFFSSILQTVARNSRGPEEQELVLSQLLGQSLPKIHALRLGLGGSFANLTAGRLAASMRGLQGQPGFLAQGAAGAMGLPGNQLRRVEADFSNRLMKAGDAATPKLIRLAVAADDAADTLENLAAGGRRTQAALDSFAHRFLGTKKGAISGPLGRLQRRLEGALNKNGDPLLEVGGQVIDPTATARPGVNLQGMVPAARGSLSAALGDMQAAGLHPTVTDAFRTLAMQRARRRRYLEGRSPYPAARPGHSAHERGTAVDLVVPPGEREAATDIMARHGFAHPLPGADPVHYVFDVHIHEHGVVAAASRHAAKKMMREVIHEVNQDHVRARPNTRNARG